MENKVPKSSLPLLIFLVMFMCTDGNTGKALEKENGADALPDMAVNAFVGAWLNQTYLDKIKETRSAKASQEFSSLCIVDVFEKGGSHYFAATWNFHEGGDVQELVLLSDTKAVSKSANEWGHDYDLVLKPDNTLEVAFGSEKHTYLKFGKGTPYADFPEAILEALFAGTYTLGGGTLTLNKDGTANGWENVVRYAVNIDYFDAGMQFDKIFLTFKGDKQPKAFGFVFEGDVLELFRLECKTSDGGLCVEYERGETVYRLSKA